MKNYKVVPSVIEDACEGCIFWCKPHGGYCLEPDELECAGVNIWVLEELEE